MTDAVEGEIVDDSVNRTTPVKLTKHPEDTVRLLEAAFNYDFNITEACHYAGISRTIYYEWLADDDVFSYRMSVAQATPKRLAKEIVVKAIQTGDANLAIRYLTLRDPDFMPKAQVKADPEELATREKIREFLDDRTDDDAGSEPTTADSTEARGEVADAPTDIS